MRYLSLLVLVLALAGCYSGPYGHDGVYPYYDYGNYAYTGLGDGYPGDVGWPGGVWGGWGPPGPPVRPPPPPRPLAASIHEAGRCEVG